MNHFTALAFALACAACTNDAAIISSDGTEQLALCSTQVTTCIDHFCPNGSRPLKGSTKITDGPLLVRCLPAKPTGQEPDGGLW